MLQTTFELLTEFSTRIPISDRRSAQTAPKVSCLDEGLKIFIKDFLGTLVPYNTHSAYTILRSGHNISH